MSGRAGARHRARASLQAVLSSSNSGGWEGYHGLAGMEVLMWLAASAPRMHARHQNCPMLCNTQGQPVNKPCLICICKEFFSLQIGDAGPSTKDTVASAPGVQWGKREKAGSRCVTRRGSNPLSLRSRNNRPLGRCQATKRKREGEGGRIK